MHPNTFNTILRGESNSGSSLAVLVFVEPYCDKRTVFAAQSVGVNIIASFTAGSGTMTIKQYADDRVTQIGATITLTKTGEATIKMIGRGRYLEFVAANAVSPILPNEYPQSETGLVALVSVTTDAEAAWGDRSFAFTGSWDNVTTSLSPTTLSATTEYQIISGQDYIVNLGTYATLEFWNGVAWKGYKTDGTADYLFTGPVSGRIRVVIAAGQTAIASFSPHDPKD